MAIDSASKRRSVAGMTSGPGVTPDATPGLDWRKQVAWTYSGITEDPDPDPGSDGFRKLIDAYPNIVLAFPDSELIPALVIIPPRTRFYE